MKIKVKPTLEIGCHRYKVSFDEVQREAGFDGSAMHISQRILLCPNLPSTRLSVSYIHEALHFITRNYSVKLGEEDLDRLCEGLGELLLKNFGLTFDFSGIPKLEHRDVK